MTDVTISETPLMESATIEELIAWTHREFYLIKKQTKKGEV